MMRRVKTILGVMLIFMALVPAFGVSASASSTDETTSICETTPTVEVLGKQVDPNAEILDLNGISLESVSQVEEILPLFPNLKQVEMCQCGISDEEMDALNKKYPDIKFVWEVEICLYFKVRTDITYFMPTQMNIGHGSGLDFSNLKYCPEIELIDLGHYRVEDLSFLNHLPKLKYLIICDGILTDITDIGNCTSLEYLEMFLNPLTDFAPLLNLTNLVDLNISYTPWTKKAGSGYVFTDEFGDVTPLYQMAWLDRLWMVKSQMEQAELDALQEALPHTEFVLESYSSTDKGWRHSPHYFAGRDIVGGGYMTK